MRVVIDGNIGSGKTHLIRLLRSKFTMIRVIEENVDEWEPYLKSFYENMEKNSLLFQMKVLEHHLTSGKKTENDKFCIHERSPLSCINVFGKDLQNEGFLKELDIKLMQSYSDNFGWIPDVVIYLQADAKVSYERCKKRNRSGEESIPQQYLENINTLYNELYTNTSNFNKTKVFIIDANNEAYVVLENTCEIISEIINSY